ncbi:uncharacterized protein LOC125821060 [Solanum verrucosum]|uniref:uncharacterized protein LOC125821060 n=1 Tax=Solanum verrucosum TaxID=315347 RepID=UPI0020D11267|nr:uncharacterized protein LOC125821060 [Solanum verrucosum]
MVVKECRTAMLVNDMDISCLMVHSQQIEEEKLKERSREIKRAKTDDDNSSRSRSDGHGPSRFQQRYGKMDHKIRDCPSVAKNEGDNSRRAKPNPSSGPSGLGSNAPKQNRFYALQTRHEQEGSADVVTVC